MNKARISPAWAILAAVGLIWAGVAPAVDEPAPAPHGPASEPMTSERLGELIQRVDENARRANASTWEFGIEDYRIAVIFDVAADRMRIMIPIRNAADLDEAELQRLMQANFDSALDARYAIARDVLWGTFIHPLSPLTDQEFLVALGQTVNVAASYGTTYSSGLLIFGGGDSGDIQRRELIERLKGLGTET